MWSDPTNSRDDFITWSELYSLYGELYPLVFLAAAFLAEYCQRNGKGTGASPTSPDTVVTTATSTGWAWGSWQSTLLLLLLMIAVLAVATAVAAAVAAAATAVSSRFLSLLRTKRTVRNLEPLLPTIFKLSLSVLMQLKRALVCSRVPVAGAFG